MARKGSTKVRTGCFTCKIRKVKCDETKPHCRRCTLSDRPCDGYPLPPIGLAAYSWDHLMTTTIPRRLPPSMASLDDLEGRALDYFQRQVGPALALHSSSHFWRSLVLQISHHEPAVRHALACIGSTYEGLDDSLSGPLQRSRERFALNQYNLALKAVASPTVDKSIVLLVCLLFICIESMHENKTLAIQHCRHGIIISNEASGQLADWAKELRPIFLRVGTLPYFFGEEGDFPRPTGFSQVPLQSHDLDTVDEYTRNLAWDSMLNRAVRQIRLSLINRRETERDKPVPKTLLNEQKAIIDIVVPWDRYFRRQRAQHPADQDRETFSNNVHFEIQCIIIKVWTACCLRTGEMRYDDFMPDFERILSLTQQIIALKTQTSVPKPKFIFEMGWMPLLYFVILSCRRLDLRLIALRHALLLACEREHLFNSRTLYFVGVRVVELEHAITLDPASPQYDGALTAPLPADEVRVRSADITEDMETRTDDQGEPAEYRKVWFLIQPGAIMPGFVEWINVGPHMSKLTSLPSMSRWCPESREKYSAVSST